LGFFEESLFLVSDFLFNFVHHALRLFELLDRHFVSFLKVILNCLFLLESIFGGVVFFLGHIKSFHLLLEDHVNVSNIKSLVGELSGKCRELISKNSDFTLKVLSINIRLSKTLSDFRKITLLSSDGTVQLSVVVLLSLKFLFVVFKISLLLIEVVFGSGVILTCLVDQLISLS